MYTDGLQICLLLLLFYHALQSEIEGGGTGGGGVGKILNVSKRRECKKREGAGSAKNRQIVITIEFLQKNSKVLTNKIF